MPLSGQAKRTYQREYMRRVRDSVPRGAVKEGESEGENMLDPLTKGKVRPGVTDQEYFKDVVWPTRQAAERYINDLLMSCRYGTRVVYLAPSGHLVVPSTGEILGGLASGMEEGEEETPQLRENS